MKSTKSNFESRCPRLYRAMQQRRDLEAALPAARAKALAEVTRHQSLVAHRDLHLLRCFARSNKRGKTWVKYLKERQAKLADAQRALDRALARVPQTWEDIAA